MVRADYLSAPILGIARKTDERLNAFGGEHAVHRPMLLGGEIG